MRPRTLQVLADGLLGLAAAVALGAAGLYAAYGAGPGVAGTALAALMPVAAMVGWRRTPPFAGWGWMVPYGLIGVLFGFSAGGLLLYGLAPFATGNLLWRWLARARREGRLGA